MAPNNWSIVSGLLVASRLFAPTSAGLVQTFCSSQNVGSTSNTQNIYNSNGECQRVCGNYAFAVVQYTSCWCSNYIPYDQLSVSSCNRDCPGFPDEKCGDLDSGLFGYVAVEGNSALGIAGAPASSSQVVQPSSELVHEVTVTDAQTVVQTVMPSAPAAAEPEPSQVVANPVPASEPSTSEAPSSSPEPTPAAGPTTQIVVVTRGGNQVTQFVTIVPPSAPTSTSRSSESSGQGNGSGSDNVSGGAIAGAVIGGIGGVAAIAGGLWFVLARRRRRNDEDADENTSNRGGTPRRNVSTMSRTGLLRSGSEKLPPVAVPAPALRRGSNGDSHHSDIASPSSTRRNSQPLFYDQRLNPSALMNLENGSHTSIATIEDGRDYTRTLNVRNPDPPARESFA